MQHHASPRGRNAQQSIVVGYRRMIICCFHSYLIIIASALLYLHQIPNAAAALSISSSSNKKPQKAPPKFVILGGTGKIGTAVAAHLLKRSSPDCKIVLVGRRLADEALQKDVRRQILGSSSTSSIEQERIEFEQVQDIWKDGPSLAKIFQDATGVIHTAGPYSEKTPTVLDAAIQAKVPVYVDVSDPLPFLDQSLERHEKAISSQTTALCAAGAFPGMSNVLAMEAAAKANEQDKNNKIQDVRFHYFTKGLGGSGTINLYITNIGFGDPMTQHDNGQRRAFTELSGKLLGSVDFFIPNLNTKDNQQAQERVGTIQQVFAWPFPEAATVASHLNIQGSSSAAMGTAPDLWNSMLGLLVDVVPRPWWRNSRFSKFMADFSQPLVLATDAILQKTSPDKVGETHAMRIDVTTSAAEEEEDHDAVTTRMVSIVQAHESFRQCVGQSCAEFALDILEHPCPGVYLPEQRYDSSIDRQRIIGKLTTTPGTFCYTGPVQIATQGDSSSSDQHPAVVVYPANIHQAVAKAKRDEEQT